MANNKTFADLRKPARRPTTEEIAAFEETGRAIQRAHKVTERADRKAIKAESREHGNTETLIAVDTAPQEHANPPTQEPVSAGPQNDGNTETRVSGPIVRLTIDLSEPAHTRFKTACAMTKRKMVDEVRSFIERRTAELERDAGRDLG
jgi:hypothetical protein